MTNNQKIDDAIASCIHQMLDIRVEVDNLESARDYATRWGNRTYNKKPNEFCIRPHGQMDGVYYGVFVTERAK